MTRTPSVIRELLEQSGYVWDGDLEGWRRRGEHPSMLSGRVLDAEIAAGLTIEQIAAWIADGEADAR